MHLILSSLGTVALFVRKRLILSGVAGEETGVLVHTVAARLSEALGVSLVEQVTDSPLEEILTRFSAETPNSWLPEVSATDVELLSPDDLASKYNLIRATFYSDDRVITGDFFADDWFVLASDDQILRLSTSDWARSRIADTLVYFFESTPQVAPLFSYLRLKGGDTGFDCEVNANDALSWLRRHRYGLWARIRCATATPPVHVSPCSDVVGQWTWRRADESASVTSFSSPDEAAVDAVTKLGLTIPSSTPQFLAYWSKGAFHTPALEDSYQIVGPAFFCQARGYSTREIAELAGLEVGATWTSHDYGAAHTVRRIS